MKINEVIKLEASYFNGNHDATYLVKIKEITEDGIRGPFKLISSGIPIGIYDEVGLWYWDQVISINPTEET